MRKILLAPQCVFWMALFVLAEHLPGRVAGESLLAQQSQSRPPIGTATRTPVVEPSPSTPSQVAAGQKAPPESANLEAKVQPAVIWVTTFDSKGDVLRTESGFLISADGRFVTTEHAVEGAVNAVAKIGDGDIYNVSGILAASKALGLAVLQADVKPRKLLRFLDLNKTGDLSAGASVTVIGSALAGNEGSARTMSITVESPNRLEMSAATPASLAGAPVVNENGEVVGVIISEGEKTTARPIASLESVLSAVAADTQPHWPKLVEASPTPHATPKPRLTYAPAPSFPPGQSLSGQSGTGRFVLTFDVRGNVTNVQIVKSTGNPYFDQAAVKTLRQWKSSPSGGWQATVPVTFQTR